MNPLLTPNAQAPALFVPTPTKKAESSLPFFRIYSLLKCPVVGVCLTLEEQRKVVRKAGMLPTQALPFDIHEILVSTTDEENILSRRVDILLRKKYEHAAVPLRRLSLLDFMRCWDTAFSSGSFAAELWAAASRVDLPRSFQRHIFGCVHMAMHNALEQAPANEEKLRKFRLERQKADEQFRNLKVELSKAHKDLRSLRLERDSLQRQHSRMNAENTLLKEHLATAEAKAATHHSAAPVEDQAHIASLTHSVENLRAQLQSEKKRHAENAADRNFLQDIVQQLQKEIEQLLKSRSICSTCPEEEHCQCCPRRVLIVGGMSRMESLYRQVVEARGDAFEYHDGCPNGIASLKNSLQRADLVLCPVNCNSHSACLMVKGLCKKYKKNLHLMHNFSLSAVTKVITAE